ncbi:MAG: DUF481 domain-containing protein [bacterium]
MSFSHQKLLATVLTVLCLHWSGAAQTPLTPESQSPNVTPVITPDTPPVIPPVEIAPVITNEVPVVTNQVPVIKPKTGVKSGTSNVLSAFASSFGSSYSVSGRTLKFPVSPSMVRSTTDWQRNLDFGMNMTRGNSDTLRYSLGVDTVKEKDANTIRLRAHGAYGESDGTKDTENAAATLRYERQLTTTMYALGTLDWATDPMAELSYRFTGILSPGVHLIRTKSSLLNLEIGAGYVEEKKDKNEDGYAAGRTAITAEKLMNDHVLGWVTVEYIPKLADPSVSFINSEIGLASYITRNLSLNVCYQNRYDSTPSEDVKPSDTILSTALSLSF